LGDLLKAEVMVAYALGEERQRRENTIGKLAKGAKT